MARLPAAAVSGLNCSESAVAGHSAAASRGSGARTHKTAGEEGRRDCSHCRRDINASQHRPARLYILRPGLACSSQGACSERWPALQHAGCTAVHSPATATTKIHSADNPSNWIHHSTPLHPLLLLWPQSGVQPTFHHERLSGQWRHEMMKTVPPMQ